MYFIHPSSHALSSASAGPKWRVGRISLAPLPIDLRRRGQAWHAVVFMVPSACENFYPNLNLKGFKANLFASERMAIGTQETAFYFLYQMFCHKMPCWCGALYLHTGHHWHTASRKCEIPFTGHREKNPFDFCSVDFILVSPRLLHKCCCSGDFSIQSPSTFCDDQNSRFGSSGMCEPENEVIKKLKLILSL